MIDQLYNDFTTKLLPKIAEGMVITKDFFLDLFGKYAKFLFVQDLIYTIACFLGLVIILIIMWKIHKFIQKSGGDNLIYMFFMFAILPITFSILGFFTYLSNTIKDKFIPEIRIYEELKKFNNK